MKQFELIGGDSRIVLSWFPDNYFDSVVTDPPYELGFMGKGWDSSGIAYDAELWSQAFRALKPGGYLLSFGGTRTYHRMACAIEDAGFILHPMLGWIFGSGFPKATNASKQIDKHFGAEREVVGQKVRGDVQKAKGTGSTFAAADANKNNSAIFGYGVEDLTESATLEAKQFDGWYYGRQSLKPALEPICMAQKPPEGKMVENLLKWGTGAINVDGCRIEGSPPSVPMPSGGTGNIYGYKNGKGRSGEMSDNSKGRWPANVIHDGSDQVEAEFAKYGNRPSCNAPSLARPESKFRPSQGKYQHQGQIYPGDSGSASRFFYSAKASKKDRHEAVDEYEDFNKHPTVKPTELMEYLVKLVTPPNGRVLDPFCGSGSTGKACLYNGFRFIGIDLHPEHLTIARKRIRYVLDKEPLLALLKPDGMDSDSHNKKLIDNRPM